MQNGNRKSVELLINNGADSDIQYSNGNTVLQLADRCNNQKNFKYYIANLTPANPNPTAWICCSK